MAPELRRQAGARVAVWLDDHALRTLPGVDSALARASATVMRSFARVPNPATVAQLGEYQQIAVVGGRDLPDLLSRLELATTTLPLGVIAVVPPGETSTPVSALRGPGVVDVLPAKLPDAATRILTMSAVPIVSGRNRQLPRLFPDEPRRAGDASIISRVLAIASSTGGCWVLAELLRNLPSSTGAVVVAQHMDTDFVRFFAEWLESASGWRVEVVGHQVPLSTGVAYLAEGNRDLCVLPGALATSAPASSRFIPSADRLFTSVAQVFGPAGTGLVLSGMGNDGAAGLAELARKGGRALCQLPTSAIVASMPESALKLVPGALVAAPEALPAALSEA